MGAIRPTAIDFSFHSWVRAMSRKFGHEVNGRDESGLSLILGQGLGISLAGSRRSGLIGVGREITQPKRSALAMASAWLSSHFLEYFGRVESNVYNSCIL